MKRKYVLIDWTEARDFIEEEWFLNDSILVSSVEEIDSMIPPLYFIPYVDYIEIIIGLKNKEDGKKKG